MDEKFQDSIDNYLLNRMDDAEKTEFLRRGRNNKKEDINRAQPPTAEADKVSK